MHDEGKKSFDFSLDALLFQKRLLKVLKEEESKLDAAELTDDELAFVNAAGVPMPAKEEDPLKGTLPIA